MNLTGTVNSLPDAKGNLFVQMGILRSQVNISDLELIEEPLTVTAKQMRRTSSGKMKMGKSMHVSPEINLLGKTVDEAVAELDKYLDDAYIAHLSPVRIVHGERKPAHSETGSISICAARNISNPSGWELSGRAMPV